MRAGAGRSMSSWQGPAAAPKTHANIRADAGGGTTDLMANKPTIGQLAPPGTNWTTTETANRPQTDHRQTRQHQTIQACEGQNRNGVARVGDNIVRHAGRRPHPGTQ